MGTHRNQICIKNYVLVMCLDLELKKIGYGKGETIYSKYLS